MEQSIRVPQKRVRNYGIDILKILSMFMVVILHTFGNGGIIANIESGTTKYAVAYFIKAAAYSAVNIFGMVSGYLIVNSKCNALKMIPLWLTVVFYSSIIGILFKFIPYLSEYYQVSFSLLIKLIFFPAISKAYWYYTSYFGLYFFIPYINKMLHAISKKDHRNIIIIIIILFSLSSIISKFKVDVFETKRGYSPLWLGCLYIIGAYLKLYPVKFSKVKSFILYIFSVICIWTTIFTDEINFFSYDNIFVILSAFGIFMFFSQITIANKTIQKFIVLCSSISFSVYLIHEHPIIHKLLTNKFASYAKDPIHMVILKGLGTALTIYMCSSIIDLFRYYLFKYIKVNSIPRILEKKLSKKDKIKEKKDKEEVENIKEIYMKLNTNKNNV
ncbi:hypothetical protein BCR36DRAFT_353164 [Piromyces finnis]|uniref:Acyltransferase 3 domain-containing protein n=1 Tax=Piromyces finnis TaxID=1754191 RepID=A0A1Y1V8W2_9FUNG|nr:hypothetical protein BCR36DRAFT_353164 [Piromyces finnis]|eukprot:ORX49623.1 hypothetical protein BCR36DRAFT_353164 [Piromyces finnis]